LPTKKRCGMSGIRLLADTNAFIYLLNGHPSLQSLLESTWLYSFITEIELLGKPGITPAEIKKIKSLLSACVKVQHTEAVNETAIALKQRHKLKIPDAIIAATAIKQGIPLLTFDKDFTKIEEVDIVLLES
jgi:predicted nucleic acid-binding protein